MLNVLTRDLSTETRNFDRLALRSRERQIRRKAMARAFTLEKSRERNWYFPADEKYRLSDDRNIIVIGSSRRAFDASLIEIEQFLDAQAEG